MAAHVDAAVFHGRNVLVLLLSDVSSAVKKNTFYFFVAAMILRTLTELVSPTNLV